MGCEIGTFFAVASLIGSFIKIVCRIGTHCTKNCIHGLNELNGDFHGTGIVTTVLVHERQGSSELGHLAERDGASLVRQEEPLQEFLDQQRYAQTPTNSGRGRCSSAT